MNKFPVVSSLNIRLGSFSLENAEQAVESPSGVFRQQFRLGLQILRTPYGNFRFETRPVDGGGFEVFCRGTVRKTADFLRIWLFRIPELRADHVLCQHFATGGCHSLFLKKGIVSAPLASYFQTIVRSGKSFLQFSTPMVAADPVIFRATPAPRRLGECRMGMELVHPPRGRKIDSGAVRLQRVADPLKAMSAYGDAVAAREKALAQSDSGCGWNSWDYYRWTVTEDAVLRNAEFIRRDPVLGKHIRRMIIDDGWNYCYGEWEANSLFPSGMKAMAQTLKKMGFAPGLWFAPAICEPHSRIAQIHGDMLARGESGYPCIAFECMGRKGFVLDPTTQKVQSFLSKLFGRYVDYGYEYFKLDFLKSVCNAKLFSDASVGPGKLMAALLAPIRRSTAGRAMLLGCNYPFYAGAEWVDAARTASDIHARYDSILENSVSIAARFWMGKIFRPDPDFALCRSPETSSDPDLMRLKCAYIYVMPSEPVVPFADYQLVDRVGVRQIEILLSLVLISAGAVNLSDNLCRLNEAGLEMARKVVSAERAALPGVPLDLFAAEVAGVYLQKMRTHDRLLLINWDEKRSLLRRFDMRSQSLAEVRSVRDFWTGRQTAVRGNFLEYELPPRSCRLLELF